MSTNILARPAWAGRRHPEDLRDGLVRLLRIWIERSRSRRALARLAPHELLDVGIGAERAAGEARKPFWRA